MSMKKKALAAASYVMVAALAIGGTVAYLTDTDNDTNVMTLGNVDIELIEQQRDGKGGLEEFQDGKELTPLVGSAQGATDKDEFGMPTATNYVDKIVNVKNTGRTDAYVRVVVAVPAALEETGNANGPLHWNYGNRFMPDGDYDAANNNTNAGYSDIVFSNGIESTIDGIAYNIYTMTYKTPLSANDTTDAAAFVGFYLDSSVDYDNEKGCYTFNGTEIAYDLSEVSIPVQAQAVQAAGFVDAEAAFAAANFPENPWANGMETKTLVSSEEDLIAAIAAGGGVAIDGDVVLAGEKTTISEASTIKLNGGTLTASRTDASAAGSSALDVRADTTLTGTGTVENEIDYCLNLDNNATLTIESGTYKGVVTAVNVVTGTLKIQGGSFEVGESNYGSKYLINCKDEYLKAGTANIVITGGTFKNWDPSASAAENPIRDFVADGYKVVSETDANGDVWYTVVAAK